MSIKKSIFIIILMLLLLPTYALSAGSGPTCDTKYPIVLAHGMGTQAEIMQFIPYWGDIDGALEDEGAEVYITSVNAMDSTASKAAQWAAQVDEILAVTGAEKVNVIGHSHGCLYTRYAISNLGLADKVASHTSLAGVHRGSAAADMIMGLIPNDMEPMVGDVLNTVMSFIMGDENPDSVSNGYDLTRPYMNEVFNPNTLDVPGIYYQSYAYKCKNAYGAGLFAITWLPMLYEEGDNDVLVSVDSAKWGDFKGVVEGARWGYGVNHLAAVGMMSGLLYPPAIGYDPAEHCINIVSDLKDRGY